MNCPFVFPYYVTREVFVNLRTFHFAFVVDYDAGVVFKVNKDAILPPNRLPLSDDYCRHYCR